MIEYLAPDVGLLLLCFVLRHCGVIEMHMYVPLWLTSWLDRQTQDLPEMERF